ncbi:hypothetical protein [Variovorax soli]|uniref:hypothetical protein n=1 Tax=Variovorax soli TaxID=376815 RepID=UPI00083988E7|nr:hypothetical protein [Variovorax soli]
MEKKHVLMLVSLNAANAAIGRAFLQRIKTNVDSAAAPLWIDAHGIGVFITTDLSIRQMWEHAWPDSLTLDQRMDLKDFLVLEVGPGWMAANGSKASAWLNSRFPRY